MKHKHAWDSTRQSCLKCGLLYKNFRMMLQKLDELRQEGEDTREIIYHLRCLK